MSESPHGRPSGAARQPLEPLMTADEVAPILRCDRSTVHRLANAGLLGWVPVGRKRLFATRHIEKYLADQEHAAKPVQVPARPKR
jgi:excisionase family DNA binding protein